MPQKIRKLPTYVFPQHKKVNPKGEKHGILLTGELTKERPQDDSYVWRKTNANCSSDTEESREDP